jgi:hypothetical protein
LAIEPGGLDFGPGGEGGGGASGDSGESGGVAGDCESDAPLEEASDGGCEESDGLSSSSCAVSSSASASIGFPSGPFLGLIHRGEYSDLDGRVNAAGVEDANDRRARPESITNAERLHVWRTDEAVAIRKPCQPNQLMPNTSRKAINVNPIE